MITISFVGITLFIASIVSIFFIIVYCQNLKINDYEMLEDIKILDICEIEEMKIICR